MACGNFALILAEDKNRLAITFCVYTKYRYDDYGSLFVVFLLHKPLIITFNQDDCQVSFIHTSHVTLCIPNMCKQKGLSYSAHVIPFIQTLLMSTKAYKTPEAFEALAHPFGAR